MASIRRNAILWKGTPVDVEGPMLKVGDHAPADWTLVGTDMAPVSGRDLAGKPRILLTVPSLDTPVCDVETRRFNQEASKVPAVRVVTVSMDLPFAQKRYCAAAGIERVKTMSDYMDREFGIAHGVHVPSKGLMARAVFVIDNNDVIRHVEYVKDATLEPDYVKALEAARAMV